MCASFCFIASLAFSADRGNGNTSDGAFSLYALTSGYGNTALGYDSMRFNTTGNYNVGIGFRHWTRITRTEILRWATKPSTVMPAEPTASPAVI